ncbi:hypothetical protein N5K21_17790 [Rhizobium pusense]|uniref:hypothetical protein n=1 Tax=Agrobacterium pusense TaxID=648995 RepID=UPI00244A9236|nr:hypothetical protein [Agrobacterium pusense]MDH2090587.1 hypothetical protein [Agrobacterium pusense]
MKKMKNALASSARVGFDYASFDISPEISAELEAKAKSLIDLGRKETDHIFELGALLEEASAHIPDGTFGKWVEARCNISARTARNWRGVYRNLGGYRDRAVELAIGPTVLIQLISAPADKIEAAFAFAVEQGRIQVADVKAILAGDEMQSEDETEIDVIDLGGVHGLKAMVDTRTRESRMALLRNLLGLLKILSGAVAEAESTGKRLKKSRIAPKAEVHAYHAYELLSSLGTGVGPQGDGKSTTKVGLPSTSRWKKVEALLWRLRDSSNWARVDSLEEWLETVVIPILTWATSNEKSPAWPLPEEPSSRRATVAASSLSQAEIEDDQDVDLDEEAEEAEMVEAEADSDVQAGTEAHVANPIAALLSATRGQRKGPGRHKLELITN